MTEHGTHRIIDSLSHEWRSRRTCDRVANLALSITGRPEMSFRTPQVGELLGLNGQALAVPLLMSLAAIFYPLVMMAFTEGWLARVVLAVIAIFHVVLTTYQAWHILLVGLGHGKVVVAARGVVERDGLDRRRAFLYKQILAVRRGVEPGSTILRYHPLDINGRIDTATICEVRLIPVVESRLLRKELQRRVYYANACLSTEGNNDALAWSSTQRRHRVSSG